ncbi:S41 family peptidase [Lysobacter capsici]|uniref:S41 family peptidase n=1 Tax=Lysobacter capsici TaxID=435897 RepID=UPI001C0036E1|nr:S41 family peptidase [Lysobacter capsici]QWF15058.1 S41 family peptidase [Lysobacter capsici]
MRVIRLYSLFPRKSLRDVLKCSALLGMSLLFAAAQAATPSPRATVSEVADAIQTYYYDIDRAKQIAADLRGEAAQGRYDRYVDPRDLATALSERIRPLDGHFRVNWRVPDPAGQAPRPGPRPGPGALPPAPGGAAPVDFSPRRNYGLRRVEVLPGNVGYIDLRELPHFEFGEPNAPARRALEAALQLVVATDALIIDLRDNGGGSPAAVGYLTSAFTPKNADIYNRFRLRRGDKMLSESEAPTDWYPTPRLQVPLYVLTSARTGSAAEALAYTLKNAGRAVVVGQASVGAANPGGEIPLAAGFSVFVSTGSPVSPITHGNWEGTGVIPDVAVAPADALSTAQRLALEAVLKRGLGGAAAVDTRWALDALQAPAVEVNAGDYLGQYERIQIGQDGGRVILRNGQRPPQPLAALQRDVFFVAADPSVRIKFERASDGRVAALEVLRSDGSSNRYRVQNAP